MYSNTKKIEITAIIEYESCYDSEIETIKEIIKQLTDLKNIKELKVVKEK